MVTNSYLHVYKSLREIVAYASFVYLICFRNYTGWGKKMLQYTRIFFYSC